MEIIFLLIGIILFGIFTFLLIEHPYYLVSLFVFMTIYNFNLELPGPFDLRGIISIILFIRLTAFDRKNLDLIKELFTYNFFTLLLIFTLYTIAIDFLANINPISIFRFFILNAVAFLIGYLTAMNGYLKKTIVLAILITGLFSLVDIVYSFSYKSVIYIRRIIDLIFSRQVEGMNHNMFGELCGMALITTIILYLSKHIKKGTFILLSFLFSLGTILSTSRMTILTVICTVLVILFTQHKLSFSLKKLFTISIASILFFIVISFSFTFILSAININEKLADVIQWRLFEEPLTLLNDDYEVFTPGGYRTAGSISWRIGHTTRDVNVFFNQSTNVILFGFGTGGYSKIGEISFRNGDEAIQYAAHNFYTNIVIEYGLIGLTLFLSFFIFLLFYTVKKIKKGFISFSLVYLLLFMFISTIGSEADLTNKFGYILYGCVIADLILEEKFGMGSAEDYRLDMNPV